MNNKNDYVCKIKIYSGSFAVCTFITGVNITEKQAGVLAGKLFSIVMDNYADNVFERNFGLIIKKIPIEDSMFFISDKG